MKSIIILFAFIGIRVVQGANRTGFLEIGEFECAEKEGQNYTYITRWTTDAACTGYEGTGTDYLITTQQDGKRLVNVLSVLVESGIAAGAYYEYEVLYLATTGNLEGKYLYLKEIGLMEQYLKKCSSVLSYSYTTTKIQILLIADKLDLNIFIKPTGAFETFIKSANSICQGTSIIV